MFLQIEVTVTDTAGWVFFLGWPL